MANEVMLGLIFGNRSFFPDPLVKKGREEVLAVLDKQGIGSVSPSPQETKLGAVETREDAKECAKLFRGQKDKIDGILVSLPNFGDEKGVAETIRMADLNVPVLVHAFPDQVDAMGMGQRRDAFCGKLSVCNNLKQYGIPFSLTGEHVQSPNSESFTRDLTVFKQVCKIVRGLNRILHVRPLPDRYKFLMDDAPLSIFDSFQLHNTLLRCGYSQLIRSAFPAGNRGPFFLRCVADSPRGSDFFEITRRNLRLFTKPVKLDFSWVQEGILALVEEFLPVAKFTACTSLLPMKLLYYGQQAEIFNYLSLTPFIIMLSLRRWSREFQDGK